MYDWLPGYKGGTLLYNQTLGDGSWTVWEIVDVISTGVTGLLGKGVGAAAKGITNPVPETLARVIPDGIPAVTLGRPGTTDVFVTAAKDIQGLNAAQIAERLTIQPSPTGFRIIEFSTPQSGIASPVFRSDPGFIGGGRTLGGAREFLIPNQSTPIDAVIRTVR